jgi:hypothetical protein
MLTDAGYAPCTFYAFGTDHFKNTQAIWKATWFYTFLYNPALNLYATHFCCFGTSHCKQNTCSSTLIFKMDWINFILSTVWLFRHCTDVTLNTLAPWTLRETSHSMLWNFIRKFLKLNMKTSSDPQKFCLKWKEEVKINVTRNTKIVKHLLTRTYFNTLTFT